MSQSCGHNCSECGKDCRERKQAKNDFLESPHELSNIGRLIGIISGKGGVGKSLVTSMLAVQAQRAGLKVGILDADITGPSIPKAFGLTQKAEGSDVGLFPVKSRTGISVMSINLLLQNETDPVVWRGPVIANAVKQFWTDVVWGDIDCLFIDMPPGTGDVPLTVFQSVRTDGVVVVTSPQELVSMIVAKAIKMAGMMKVPILGLVENMSYAVCPSCGERIPVFGESRIEAVAAEYGVERWARIPIDPKLAAACDRGMIELFEGDWLDGMMDIISKPKS